MNIKQKKKALLMSLAGLLSLQACSCGSNNDNYELDVVEPVPLIDEKEDNIFEINDIEELVSSIPKKSYNIVDVPCIIAMEKVDVLDECDGKVIGRLKKDGFLKLVEKLEKGYKVEYYDQIGFVSNEFVYESTYRDIEGKILGTCYATEDLSIYLLDSDDNYYKREIIPKNEFLEIYEETEEEYLVKTNEYIGYVMKQDINFLEGTFIVVDISDQEVKLYKNNEVMLKFPVVTGKPSENHQYNYSTSLGLFDIYQIDYDRYLKGPGYSSYVDTIAFFHRGEGFHDASYHNCTMAHGWRNKEDFGGDTYLTNGSHGCVNMLHDDVFELLEHTGIGTKVLIKK